MSISPLSSGNFLRNLSLLAMSWRNCAKLTSAVFLILALAITQASACQTLIGMTFTHYKIDPTAVCTNGRQSAHVMAEGSIIPHYDDPLVRQQVEKDLIQAKTSGFGLIRTVIWFTQDRIIAPWGQVPAPLTAGDAQKIRQFGADVKAAGFHRWMVVFSPGIKNSPLCKMKTWGDCWDSNRTTTNINFIDSVYRNIVSLTGPKFIIEYDLSGEMCPSQYLPATTNANIDYYITKLIVNFHRMAPSAPIHVSCGGFGNDRAAKMLQIFKKAGIRPNAVDIHFYDVDAAMVAKKLLPAAALAEENHLPLEIGEMQYENAQQAAIIGALAKQNNICFSELIQWPRVGFTKCQMNVNPPFSDRVIQKYILSQEPK